MNSVPTSSLYTFLSDGDMSEPRSTLTSRIESSLGVITKKFLLLLKDAPNMELDLNHAATILEIHKRRLYDITNVLEGVGCISKRFKNSVRYSERKLSSSCAVCSNEAELHKEDALTKQLLLEEQDLEEKLQAVNNEIQTLANQEENIALGYVPYSELRSLDSLAHMSLFVVKTPPGTLLDFPCSDSTEKSVLTLTSHIGKIDVLYLRENGDAEQ